MRLALCAGVTALLLSACAHDLTDDEIAAIAAECKAAEADMAPIEERIEKERAEQSCAADEGHDRAESIRRAVGGD